MYLRFEIEYSSNNGLVEKIASKVAKKTGIDISLSKENDKIYIYTSTNEEEVQKFANALDKELPQSIFLGKIDAKVVDKTENNSQNFPSVSLPPCPECLKKLVKNYDFTQNCEVCGYKNNLTSRSYEKEIKEWAKKITQNETITIKTMNGIYEISKVTKESEIVVASDLKAVAKYFVSFEGDAKALASIEKPTINLKPNINFRTLTSIFDVSNYKVKLPDDAILTLLSFELSQEVPLLGLKKAIKAVDFDFEVEIQKPICGVVTDTKKHKFIITSGERGLIKPNIQEYNPDKKPYFGYFGVLNQYNLNDKTTMAFPLYKKHPSKVFMNSPKFGLVDYVSFDFEFKDFSEIFAEISIDETGKKLMQNFKNKQPELFANALESNLKSDYKGVYYLWGLIGCVLGFDTNIQASAKKLLQLSNEALTKKGPRIDYKLKEKSNNLNPLWALRTAMSFKLAGVDDNLICYGVIESFAEFLNNLYEGVNRDTPLDGAIIVGDLYEGEFLNKTYTYISKNYPTFTPKAMPISGWIEGYGAYIASK